MSIDTNTKDGVAPQGDLKPEWIRPKDVQRFFGLGRTQTYELLAANKIKSVSMRKRGQKHGTRLISYSSLSAFLESLATGGE
ncbi:helix-turn-helix domain-containing protein [bacterium]|nr:helix-turn-helix domain-containing protein [bacterium]